MGNVCDKILTDFFKPNQFTDIVKHGNPTAIRYFYQVDFVSRVISHGNFLFDRILTFQYPVAGFLTLRIQKVR